MCDVLFYHYSGILGCRETRSGRRVFIALDECQTCEDSALAEIHLAFCLLSFL